MNTIDVRPILKSQYHASLAMLGEAIEFCPENTWYDRTPRNAFWQVAYHTLFFAELYLGKSPEAYRGWSGHQANVQHPDGIPGDADPRSSLPMIADPLYPRPDSGILAHGRFHGGQRRRRDGPSEYRKRFLLV